MLLRADPSPVVELNRAAAIAMRDGPAAGLALIDAILRAAISPTTRWRTPRAPISAGAWGAPPKRAPSYERALTLTRQEPQRRFLDTPPGGICV